MRLIGLMLMIAAPAVADTTAFQGAHLITAAGPEIPNGLLVIRNDKITYVGAHDPSKIPADARVIDVTGKVLMPGLVDTHSHIGRPSGADDSGAIQPETRVLDSINVRAARFRKARAGGVTTANIMPGSGYLLSGQTLYVKLRPGKTIDDLLLFNEDGTTAGGIKMANGTNPRRDKPGFPGTRAKAAAMIREQFIKARDYQTKAAAAKDDPDKAPPRDLGLEALVEVLEGKRLVHHHTHRHDDILTVLRIAKEFGYQVVLHHVSDGWKVADELAASGVPCSIIHIDSPGGKLEAKDLLPRTGAILEKAGIPIAYHTDDPITDSRLFLRSAAFGMRYGLSREGAIASVTLNGAKMLQLDHRTGSLEAGKDADFLILSGDPFSVYTKIQETWVEGQQVFNLADPEDRLYAVGGFGASDELEFHHHDHQEAN